MLQSKALNKHCLQFCQKDYSAYRVHYHNSLSVTVIKHGNGRLAVAVLLVLSHLRELAKEKESDRMARHSKHIEEWLK